mmetsp:Transcript_32546/g.82271  ORF Transcript_32546/g.82271 Transcript_32546/m.82271 type:complete len:195 (+) Transcript_32546:3-587(+)
MQMLRSIAWLHANKVVHRDVKGDNFLLDRADLAHPDCRIYLSDFGTTVTLGPEERLREICGTKVYWAPEVYQQSYAFKADVWAAGVITHCLITRRFPFMDKKQVFTKRVKAPSRCGEAGKSFLLGLLERCEAARLSASEALEDDFLTLTEATSPTEDLAKASFEMQARRFDSDDGDKEESTALSAATTAASSCR